MKTYRNKETGALIQTNSVCAGSWELVEEPAPKTEKKKSTKKKASEK